ncbi:MAG: type II toxin-antitoxin system PemK/MazF family toxin [Candidatus Yonathbacteria bacterium]|nr:type II toxin-antitoxin system PemK/MazF family toxin [Candidatus Yonathbacteria bacterium]
MSKDFDSWNKKKRDLDQRESSPFCHERELWWCTLGVNVGFEQDGSDIEYRRPVLILKGLSKQTCLVIPLTTSTHAHKLRPAIGLVDGEQAHALLSQMRVIDTKRLVRKIGNLDKQTFDEIRKTVKDML